MEKNKISLEREGVQHFLIKRLKEHTDSLLNLLHEMKEDGKPVRELTSSEKALLRGALLSFIKEQQETAAIAFVLGNQEMAQDLQSDISYYMSLVG